MSELLDAIDRRDFRAVKASIAELKAVRGHVEIIRTEYTQHRQEHGC